VFKLIIDLFNLFVLVFVSMFLGNVSLFPYQVVNAYYVVFLHRILLQKYLVFFHLAIRLQSYKARFLILWVKYSLLSNFNCNMYSLFECS
jgi:hypothetical protein